MFDKLIVSEPEGAEFKSRRSYFMVSTLVVGVLFGTAVVISIFASDYRLGANTFDLVELIAPPNMIATEPEPPRLRVTHQSAAPSSSKSLVPTRKDPVANINETPTAPPKGISVTPNTNLSRPIIGQYKIASTDSDPGPGAGSGRNEVGAAGGPTGLVASGPVTEEPRVVPEPPVIKVPPPVIKPATQSLGVINGRASSLPKPSYPAAARAVKAQGKVNVQVTIDEDGRVVSARAVDGNPLLRNAAEAAARNARFTTTFLSNVPVKVTGVIVYNFSLG